MAKLALRENITYEDTTVMLTGHAYRNCKFNRCTLVYRGSPVELIGCEFTNVVWQVDVLLHEQEQVDQMCDLLLDAKRGLP